MRSSICGPAEQLLEVIVAKPGSRLARVVVLIVVVAAIAGTLLYMKGRREPKDLTASGTLEARTVNVGSLVGGRVTRVLVDEGSRVPAGQVLVTLETETLGRQIAEQRAAIEVARAQYQKALAGPRPEEIAKAAAVAANDERDRIRQAVLFREGIVSKQLLDDAATKAKTSADDLKMLKKGTRKEDIEAARAEVEQQQRR